MINTHLRPLRTLATLLAGLGTAWAVSASPAIYLLNATTGPAPEPDLSNVEFAIVYEDLDANMLFSLNELLVFQDLAIPGGPFTDLLAIPDSAQTLASSAANEWRFGNGVDEAAFGAARFTPFSELLQAAVPLPGSGWLAGLGLLGVVGLRRRA